MQLTILSLDNQMSNTEGQAAPAAMSLLRDALR
jgi:hypothetical protein